MSLLSDLGGSVDESSPINQDEKYQEEQLKRWRVYKWISSRHVETHRKRLERQTWRSRGHSFLMFLITWQETF